MIGGVWLMDRHCLDSLLLGDAGNASCGALTLLGNTSMCHHLGLGFYP